MKNIELKHKLCKQQQQTLKFIEEHESMKKSTQSTSVKDKGFLDVIYLKPLSLQHLLRVVLFQWSYLFFGLSTQTVCPSISFIIDNGQHYGSYLFRMVWLVHQTTIVHAVNGAFLASMVKYTDGPIVWCDANSNQV